MMEWWFNIFYNNVYIYSRVLRSNENGEDKTSHNMCRHCKYALIKEAGYKRMYTMWNHLYKAYKIGNYILQVTNQREAEMNANTLSRGLLLETWFIVQFPEVNSALLMIWAKWWFWQTIVLYPLCVSLQLYVLISTRKSCKTQTKERLCFAVIAVTQASK